MYDMTEREIEDKDDILMGSLDEILRKLELKGAEQPDIEKYKEMRLWRLKRDKTVREQLEQYTIQDKKGDKRRSIIDSSQLVGARVIMKYYKRLKKRKHERDDAIGKLSNTDPEVIKNRRQANVMEREVQRKKHRMHQTIDVDEQMNRRKGSMPQIQEAENEDKDYQTDVRPAHHKNK